jgi:hypothetical protein
METPSESDWMKGIDNQTVCTFFWWFFVAFSIYTLYNTLMTIYVVSMFGFNTTVNTVLILFLMLLSFISISGMLFHYLICDRLIVA